MARELKLITWCDGDHEEDVPSTTVRRLSVDGGPTILLDLCDVCDKVVQDVFVLMDSGVPESKAIFEPTPTPRKRTPSTPPTTKPIRADGRDRRDCPECDYIGNTRSAMGQHLKQKHHKQLSDFDWSTA